MQKFIKKLIIFGMMAVVMLSGVRVARAIETQAGTGETEESACFCEATGGGKAYQYGCYLSLNEEKKCKEASKVTPTAGKPDVVLTCSWMGTIDACKAKVNEIKSKVSTPATSQLIPDCALKDDLTGECTDVSIFLLLLIKITNYLFSIIGALALAMLVYGGVLLVISEGNSEKTKKGIDTLMAAFIGLGVAFAGYMLINFLAGALGVTKEFKL